MGSLRQDLALHAGEPADDGSPTWTLHDPAAHRFYRLGWPAFELLSRWSLGPADAVAAVNRETTLRLTMADAEALQQLLRHNHLLQAHSAADTQRLHASAQAQRPGVLGWLLHHYLSFRLPLVRPMPWLNRAAPYLRWAFHPLCAVVVALLAGLGLLLALRRWDAVVHGLWAYASPGGALAVALAISASKIVHELGHAFAAQRHGCRVPSMGVAFLVMWPVLYTDTNEAWKLAARRARLVIGVAGIASEIALAAAASVLWGVLPDTPAWAPLRSAALVLATTTWVLTLTVNASPFMRFDGYFLLCDALNLPNLHERSFLLARWWLRERLFGLGEAAPEAVAPARRRFLVAFAFTTWVYRLVLYLGIALLVYHFFFKALGLALMAVELAWFIGRPVAQELKVWWQRRGRLRWNRASVRTALLGAGGLLVLLWPWPVSVRAPAVLGAATAQGVYAPHAGQLTGPLPAAGTRVRAGERLAGLRSPDLQHQLDLAEAREQQLQWQLAQQPFDDGLRDAGPALRKRWDAAVAEVAGLRRELDRLEMRAPFDGVVSDVADEVSAQAWVAAGQKLLVLVAPGGSKVDVYVDEADLADARAATQARFVGPDLRAAALHCGSLSADPVQLAQIDQPLIASEHGGRLPVRRLADGRMVPLRPVFRLVLGRCDRGDAPAQEQAGVATLEGPGRSLLVRAGRAATALFWREAAAP